MEPSTCELPTPALLDPLALLIQEQAPKEGDRYPYTSPRPRLRWEPEKCWSKARSGKGSISRDAHFEN